MTLWTKVLAHVATAAVLVGTFQTFALPARAQQSTQQAAQSDSNTAQAESNQQQPASTDGQPNASQQRSSSPQPAASDALPSAPEPQSTQPPQKPVGTAAAETPNVSGVAASQPAGVAIAPAKQRRVRTLVLKIGALAGAGIALGTVIALTTATPSKPPGAH